VTEAQYVTLVLGFVATIATAMIALLINNSRLTDVKEALRGEMRGEISVLQEKILSQMATYRLDIISKIAEIDNRITRLQR
jgi:hypothetical protein